MYARRRWGSLCLASPIIPILNLFDLYSITGINADYYDTAVDAEKADMVDTQGHVRVRGLPVPACGAAGPARTRRVRGGTGTYGYGAVRVRVLCHSKALPGPVPVSTRTRKDPYKI